MKRTLYLAGVNTRPLAGAADPVRWWLLSFTLLRRKGNRIPDWILPLIAERRVIWDPGTFAERAVSYLDYRRFLASIAHRGDPYLQYDEIGDPEATAWYLRDMRRRGFTPIPILQPGGDPDLLGEERMAIGGLVPMPREHRQRYLDDLFYGQPRRIGRVHLLGIVAREWFERYPALSGDSTTWIPRGPFNRSRTIPEWLGDYGEQEIPWRPPAEIQGSLFERTEVTG